jgi:GYF domain 2
MWFYADGDRSIGPLTLAALKDKLAESEIPRGVLVWREGFSRWQRAGDVPELMDQFTTPPPIPPPPPPSEPITTDYGQSSIEREAVRKHATRQAANFGCIPLIAMVFLAGIVGGVEWAMYGLMVALFAWPFSMMAVYYIIMNNWHHERKKRKNTTSKPGNAKSADHSRDDRFTDVRIELSDDANDVLRRARQDDYDVTLDNQGMVSAQMRGARPIYFVSNSDIESWGREKG